MSETAYFIGGSQDLTKKRMENADHIVRFVRWPKNITMEPLQKPLAVEIYLNRGPVSAVRDIWIYEYVGDELLIRSCGISTIGAPTSSARPRRSARTVA